MAGDGGYVLITAARDEAQYIGATIESVIAQDIQPLRWVIVSDGSTDETDAIVESFAGRHGFIRLLRRQGSAQRDFSSKVMALREGMALLEDIACPYLGILDADVTFGPDYYRALLQLFDENPKLGIAGGGLWDKTPGGFVRQVQSLGSVSGPVQMFRRACYEQIGGYQPVTCGEDAVAEISARMHGWETRTFPELKVLHHRLTGTEGAGVWKARVRLGVQDHRIGYTPLFEIVRAVSRLRERPCVLGAAALLAGYFGARLRREPYQVSSEFRAYFRREQLHRLKARIGLRGNHEGGV
ncbi:glycosyltransferase [Oceanidesulfovibrio marinus]|uniref:Glycosyltransferase family 2 protein n=1 Tax=Oceanidesulfovibrio marinus TaxID=370038 RepID=A0ABX6NAX1_9BACT|nr:glycosyltransferase family 2 protein [Oceanidesulfovibrio marinus]QJT07744.1 glycosyltransferase family 2 protein [Oceanidesulfovibrio marinus]